MTVSRIVRLTIGFLIAAFFLWLLARQTSTDALLAAFGDAKPAWIVAAILAFFAGYAFRVERWRLMLKKENPELSWRNCAGPLFASVAANNVLPFRMGDIIRALCFNQRLGITAGISITTLILERALDVMIVLGLLGTVIWVFNLDTYSLIGIGGLALCIGAFFLALCLFLFPQMLVYFLNLCRQFIGQILPNVTGRVDKHLGPVSALILHMAKDNLIFKLMGWSVLAWLAEGCVFWFCALALPSITEPIAAWLALTIGTLSTIIPSTPGFIGTFDYFTAQAMALLGNELSAATAYAVTVHALIWLPPTIVGGIYLLANPIGLHRNIESAKSAGNH